MPGDSSNKEPALPDAEWAFLMGRPMMEEAIDFFKRHSVDDNIETTVLEKQWKSAKARYDELSKKEAGLADDPPISDLPKELENLKAKVLADPVYQKVYSNIDHRIGMVDLDRLVVFQRYMDISFIKGLEASYGPQMTPQEVFRVALPFDHPLPECNIYEQEKGVYVFESPSTDLRFLDSVVLREDQLRNLELPRPLAGILGLVVGFGSNFLTAVHVGKRLILNNGTHRAYLLRKLGIKHVPCIIQEVKDRKELAEEVHGDVPDRLDYYLKDPRPSLLKDYFDPNLVYPLRARPKVRRIQIKFDVKVLTDPR